jgi:hypothetical protein
MPGEEKLETTIRELIIDICEVMHRRGFPAVSVGAIMRLVGVDEIQARRHDDELFDLDSEEFERLLEKRKMPRQPALPTDVTLH